MASRRTPGPVAGPRVPSAGALPRKAGVHRSRASADEPRGPDLLARQYACTRDAASRAALVDLCGPLVLALASAYAGGDLRDDLIQEGFVGLLRAIDRYDPSRGTPFLAFARHFIRGGISHYTRDHRWVLRPPRWARGTPRILSLDAALDGDRGEGPLIAGLVGHDASWDDRVLLIETVKSLSPLQRAAVFHVHFGGLTQAEAARRIGISQKHVSRVLAGARLRLRTALAHGQDPSRPAYPASSS